MSKGDFVTIYTDASWCPETKQAVWAFYARCDEGTLKEHGSCEGTVECNNSAEMYAIHEAIKMVSVEWPDKIGYFVNTDSLTCCEMLWPERIKKTDHFNIPQAQRIKKYIKEICPEKESSQHPWLRVKHVKAHTGKGDIRSWLNRWCDKNALKNLRKLREESNGSESRVSSQN